MVAPADDPAATVTEVGFEVMMIDGFRSAIVEKDDPVTEA
jgi:hypothetical protein